MPRLPLAKAAAMALGSSASASITFARASCALAFISCSRAMAMARRSSALACAMFLSACAWSICSAAPIFLPMSISAMSIERISNAVPLSRPLRSTSFDMLSGFSSTCLWLSDEPMLDTMPSPTRASTVSSLSTAYELAYVGAHRDSGFGYELYAVLGHCGHRGVSITLGFTLICTA